jgi:hypothetical protein
MATLVTLSSVSKLVLTLSIVGLFDFIFIDNAQNRSSGGHGLTQNDVQYTKRHANRSSGGHGLNTK